MEDGEALNAARDWAQELADGAPDAIATTKRLLEDESSMTLEEALHQEATGQARLLAGEDMRRFYEAFTRKERPRFSGRLARNPAGEDQST